MGKKRWVIKTNHERYVGIPFMIPSGYRSHLQSKPVENKTRSFYTKKEAEEYLTKYLTESDLHYVDPHTFKKGERLDGVEKVYLIPRGKDVK